MQLVIAEKPSVALSIAKVLKATKRGDGYVEGNGYVVSWCVGHLVGLSQPQEYDEKYGKWKYEDLPIIPDQWKYQVSSGTKKQFTILKNLMKRKDVNSLVCATDAGREGELIFRLVYNQCKCTKSFERLWISSMEDEAIKEGFEHLKPSKDYDKLYEAATCRERADWIVGINATRLFSCLYNQTLNVGRVMTPTLAMVVSRESEIGAFTSESFYTVQIDIQGITVSSERMKDIEQAKALQEKCMSTGKMVVSSVEQKQKNDNPSQLYDLTSLQRDANRLLGYTAKQTLDYTQSLYEKKLVTYPRTDSRYLTDDMADSVPALIDTVAGIWDYAKDMPVSGNPKQLCDSTKVSDHHAIIPTKSISTCDIKALPAGEQEILRMISARLLTAVSDPYIYAETIVKLGCGDIEFTAKGKTVLHQGWKDIDSAYRKALGKQEKETIDTCPMVNEGDELQITGSEIKEGKTSPPKRYTEDTLLSAMEHAGADEMSDEIERKGLGTSATRAGIIEKLIKTGFIERQGEKKVKYLAPTHKGISLITVMPVQIQSPSMTAEWEEKLLKIEKGECNSIAFMKDITEMIENLTKNYEAVKDTSWEKVKEGYGKT